MQKEELDLKINTKNYYLDKQKELNNIDFDSFIKTENFFNNGNILNISEEEYAEMLVSVIKGGLIKEEKTELATNRIFLLRECFYNNLLRNSKKYEKIVCINIDNDKYVKQFSATTLYINEILKREPSNIFNNDFYENEAKYFDLYFKNKYATKLDKYLFKKNNKNNEIKDFNLAYKKVFDSLEIDDKTIVFVFNLKNEKYLNYLNQKTDKVIDIIDLYGNFLSFIKFISYMFLNKFINITYIRNDLLQRETYKNKIFTIACYLYFMTDDF